MKPSRLILLCLISSGAAALGLIGLRSIVTSKPAPVGRLTEAPVPSKVDQRILQARQLIERTPNQSNGYNQLAAAYLQKARETSDPTFNASADEAISKSFAVEPDNYDALKLLAKLQLTNHHFTDALATARRALRFRTDDADVWGQITDGLVELGDYPGAVGAAQKMADLRPDSPAYARVSYLRSLHGDNYGAIQAMNLAVKAANPNDPEGVAWFRAQLGNELMNAGNLAAAERQFDEALRTFADHQLALEGMARARVAAGDLKSAMLIYERKQSKKLTADAAQALGNLYAVLGREDEAKKEYEKFETLERENAEVERSWHHLINYWLDHDRNPQEALKAATHEYETRKDIFTCDSLAWALFKNGRVEEATKLMKEALRTGTKDARINYHAGIIYKTLNMRAKAARHLRLGAALNSSFDPIQTQIAKKILAELE